MKDQPYVSPQILVTKIPLSDLLCTSYEYDDGGWTIVV